MFLPFFFSVPFPFVSFSLAAVSSFVQQQHYSRKSYRKFILHSCDFFEDPKRRHTIIKNIYFIVNKSIYFLVRFFVFAVLFCHVVQQYRTPITKTSKKTGTQEIAGQQDNRESTY